MVPLGTNHPYDRVIGTTGRGNPWRALAGLAHAPGGDDRWRTCSGDLVGFDLAAARAKNKVCSLSRRVGSRRLTSQGTVNAQRRNRSGDASKVVTVNQISIAVFTQGEN